MEILSAKSLFWKALLGLRKVAIKTETGEEGIGTVEISSFVQKICVKERGQWTSSAIVFYGQWQWDFKDDHLVLSHVRYGEPVELLQLVSITPGHFQSVEPHQCKQDRYSAEVLFDAKTVQLTWTIAGRNKNGSLRYTYTEENSKF